MATLISTMQQHDEALRLLAQMYSRWVMRTNAGSDREEVFMQIRDLLSTATSQHEAAAHVWQLAQSISDQESAAWKIYEQAHTCVEQLIEAGGSADALIVGVTDGYRHLCLSCSQQEENVQRVLFFNRRERRPLLALEVIGTRRSATASCQCCLQPIHPDALVLFVLTGTAKHPKACRCRACNRAGIAYQLSIYTCERDTLQIVLPALQQVAAPSRQQCVELAVKLCREQGWYMFNKETVLP